MSGWRRFFLPIATTDSLFQRSPKNTLEVVLGAVGYVDEKQCRESTSGGNGSKTR